MSTSTRVLKNIVNFQAYNDAGASAGNVAATNVISIRRISLADNTGEIVAGSDNDPAPKKFNSWYSFSGDIVCEDPIEANKVKGFQNAYVTFVAIDINGGNNVNVAMTGVRFAQIGLPSMEYGQEGLPTAQMSGGQILFNGA